MKRLGMKAVLAAMVLIVAIIAFVLVSVMSTATKLVDGLLADQSFSANNAFAVAFSDYQSSALERAEMIAASSDVVSAIENGDHAALLNALNNFSVGFDLITLCDAEGNVLARTHNDKVGDSVLSQQAISTALNTGKGIKTIEPGTVIGLSTRGSAAIKNAQGEIIGALTCGHDLSQPKYVDDIKNKYGCEATFFAGDTRMNTTLKNEKGERVIGETADAQVVETVINGGSDYRGRLNLFGSVYEAYYSPVVVSGKVIGMLFTGVNANQSAAQERQMTVMFAVAIVMLIGAVIITSLVIVWSLRKTQWYESILDAIPSPISVTDMNMNWMFINAPVEQMLGVKRANMIGKQCSSWGAAICNTENCGVNCLRKGKNTTFFEQMGMDFKVDIEYLHNSRGKSVGHIEIVQDISSMTKTQREQEKLIRQIDEVSGAFVAGSKQIADGAQALAQGSTEQAAAIEQLSSSITEIAQTTRENSEMAQRAEHLANSIKDNAEKGNEQMNSMMDAVREINVASQSINKVIKVIDDIAFQTNILALNAAVEAARAGQHGKGFAVVAEEVRNLAAKSADAAKDTGGLIANSMEKADIGAKIAADTAASLVEIVSGINESTQIIGDIAKSSERQNLGIQQINIGIDQVSQVVQQNSATAQESAASSQQLSEQANILKNLVDGHSGAGSQNLSLPG